MPNDYRLSSLTPSSVAAFVLLLTSLISAENSNLAILNQAQAQQQSAPDQETDNPETNPDSTETPADGEEPILPQPILGDRNGDGLVEIDAFGDSITRGVGDFISPDETVTEVSRPTGEAGYPLRVELSLGVPVFNRGIPGERLSVAGLSRFALDIPERRPDFVVISGGTNDSIDNTSSNDFFRSVQTMINIAQAVGTFPILATAPPACCSGSGISGRIGDANEQFRSLALINGIPLADISRAYTNVCNNLSSCFLLNRPEGVHPNIRGYDVSGEVVVATLLNIDIFAPDGPTLLEQALGLAPGSVITEPDPFTTPVAGTTARDSTS